MLPPPLQLKFFEILDVFHRFHSLTRLLFAAFSFVSFFFHSMTLQSFPKYSALHVNLQQQSACLSSSICLCAVPYTFFPPSFGDNFNLIKSSCFFSFSYTFHSASVASAAFFFVLVHVSFCHPHTGQSNLRCSLSYLSLLQLTFKHAFFFFQNGPIYLKIVFMKKSNPYDKQGVVNTCRVKLA